jgi:hypothetical protein
MALGGLRRYSLIERNDSGAALSIHRLVKRYSLRCTKAEELEKAILSAFDALLRVYLNSSPPGLPLTDQWSECDLYIGHLISLMNELAEQKSSIQIPIKTANLLVNSALYL